MLHKIKFKQIIIILTVIVITLLGILTSKGYAKFQSDITGNIIAKIAKPVIEITREQSILVTKAEPNGSYTFEVKNFNENQLNEVEMEYYIEIITQNDAIKYELYKDGNRLNLNNNKTEKFELIIGEEKTHYYCLQITCETDKSNYIQEDVQIKIHSIQKA